MLPFQKKHKERRLHERIEPQKDFLVEFQRSSENKFRLGQGKDISKGGVRFATSAELKKGDEVNLKFYLPKAYSGTRQFELPVKVRRVYTPSHDARFRVACEFLFPGARLQQTLSPYLEWAKREE